MAVEEARRPRARGRLAVLAVLAILHPVFAVGFLMTDQGDCRHESMCDVRNVVAAVALFGGAVVYAVATFVWGALSHRAPARASRAVTGAVALSVLLFAAFPLYATFRDGAGAVTEKGREELHADALRKIVAEVDTTVREAAPGVPVKEEKAPGTREPNDTGTCESVSYTVRIAPRISDHDDVMAALTARWRRLGMTVSTYSPGSNVSAVHGSFRYYVTDAGGGPLLVGGSGPCLKA